MSKYLLTVQCPRRRGIVAAISGFLADQSCNIADLAQFDDVETGRFFLRTSFVSEGGVDRGALDAAFAPVAEAFTMRHAFIDPAQRMKVVVMVSKFGHCLNDLFYRWRIGVLPIDITAVISNHLDH
ncbi:MAG: formyltetrahydrofolate deformylase, partial [Pseudomonadota bacterium]